MFLIFAVGTMGQEYNQELKERLRQQALPIKKIEQKQLEHDLRPILEEANKPFEVGPYAKLPRRGDELMLLNPTMPEQQINLHVDWGKIADVKGNRVDELLGEGVYDPDIWNDAPRWARKAKKVLGILLGGGFEADPVRAYQQWLAAKRQRQVNKVMSVYGMKKGDVIITFPPTIKYMPDSTYMKEVSEREQERQRK